MIRSSIFFRATTIATLALVSNFSFSDQVQAAPFYADNFNFDSTKIPNTYDGLKQTGWKAFRSGSKVGTLGLLKVAPGSDRHLTAYNSFPQGGDDGYAFWSKDVVGLTVFTEEYSFNLSSLYEISYIQRLDGLSTDPVSQVVTRDGTRIALKIRSTDGVERWYLSDQLIRQVKSGIWEQVTFLPKSLTFSVLSPQGNVGPKVPTSGGSSLPAFGVVTGFGVFLDQVLGRVRIDNFTLSDPFASNGVAPQPIPTRPTVSVPTPETPDSDPDSGLPPTTPTPTPTATPTSSPSDPVVIYSFCTPPSHHARKLVAGRSIRNVIIRSLKGSAPSSLRNRILVDLLVNAGIRADSLENVLVSDFYSHEGQTYLNVYGADRRPIRLSSRVARIIGIYIERVGLASQPNSPLFRGFSRENVASLSATCVTEISRTLGSALRNAGVARQVKFIR